MTTAKPKPPPKDLEQRNAKREELREAMKVSLVQQGAFGVTQTKQWLKVYKRATRNIARELPGTPASTAKLIATLQETCKPWIDGRPAKP